MKKCIVILSFNHPEITSRAIESSLKFNLDIILIHNGSDDRHVFKLKEKFPSVDHLVIKVNRGFTGGVNDGLTYAFSKYDWVYFITNDTEILELSNDDLEIGFYAPLIYFRKIGRVDSLGGRFNPSIAKLEHLKTSHFNLKKFERFYVPGTAFIIHKNVFESVGKLDESLNTYWEDVDYSLRVQLNFFKTSTTESFKLLHKVGKTCHDNPFYTTYLFQRNRKKISWKYANKLERIVLFFVLFKYFLIGMIRNYLKKDQKRFQLLKKALIS